MKVKQLIFFLFNPDWFLDFGTMIPPLVQQNRPAFYFIRLDTTSEISGYNWLLIVYIPDVTKVIIYIIQKSDCFIFNVGSGTNVICFNSSNAKTRIWFNMYHRRNSSNINGKYLLKKIHFVLFWFLEWNDRWFISWTSS